jgi:hypothetical protein
MPQIIFSQNQEKNPTLDGLESYLYETLKPVKPRHEFIEGLKGRVVVEPTKNRSPINPFQTTLFIAAGVISSVIIIITGIRATITLLDTIKILRLSRYQSKRQVLSPAREPLNPISSP